MNNSKSINETFNNIQGHTIKDAKDQTKTTLLNIFNNTVNFGIFLKKSKQLQPVQYLNL